MMGGQASRPGFLPHIIVNMTGMIGAHSYSGMVCPDFAAACCFGIAVLYPPYSPLCVEWFRDYRFVTVGREI